MKNLRRLIVGLIVLAILVWVAGGPITRRLLKTRSDRLIGEIDRRSEGHIIVGAISGDLWSGFVFDRTVIYTDHDPTHLPLLSADRVFMRLSLADLVRGDIIPASVHIKGFDSAIHIGPDGKIALPQWRFRTALLTRRAAMRAGFLDRRSGHRAVLITCENGVLEIHKRFPNLTEPVDIVFTQLKGKGAYSSDEGLKIEYVTGDYLSTPISLRGAVTTDPREQMRISAEIGQVQLGTVFRDIDPLFRGAEYLPKGAAKGEVVLSGSLGGPLIKGRLEIKDASVAGVSVVTAEAAVSYAAGVVDFTQVRAETYGGTVEATGQVNLLSETPLWAAVCTFKDVDLAHYLDANGYYSYEINGGFDGSVRAEGDFVDPDTLVCTAEITSEGGRYLSPFSERFMRLAQHAAPETPVTEDDLAGYDDIEVDIRIQDSEILIESFHFVSTELAADASGKVGFDHSIDVSGKLTVPVESARRHPRFGRFVGFLPDTLDRASLDFSLSGRLDDIRFSAKPGENLLKGLLDQSGDLLGDLDTTPVGPGN